MPQYREEHDSMGTLLVEADKLWGAQTQRSLENFKIGTEKMPREIIRAFGILKKAAALSNSELLPERMTARKLSYLVRAADEVISGELSEHFPLAVWQTGSGTQSNMNVNEVIANRANLLAGEKLLHPNDDVNMSQSSNDTFPTAMHIAAVIALEENLIPALRSLAETFSNIEKDNYDIIKSGRTHLQDATPIRFSQEISAFRYMLDESIRQIKLSEQRLYPLALGGTAVGTGINAPGGFDTLVAEKISALTSHPFTTSDNKFHALTSKDALAFSHGALKALAANLMKIANDVRLLASGPRLGIGEITIPENEPGSSIMPGKVNPTQCEALTMVCVQVMANDTAVAFSASQGNFQLNVFMPVIIHNYLSSVRLLADAVNSFNRNCAVGIKPNKEKMRDNLNRSLMTVTALNPYVGYENAARIAKLAYSENITLREATVRLGYLTEEQFDKYFDFNKMV